ncbi:MAG: DUF1801 domain-containing protein [Gammaproteobacteria bacterium]|nr:DUF1801 domain-containing protein [Gammaproteobacteria bacterium]
MSDLKTRPTASSVDAFIDTVDDEHKRADCRVLAGLMAEITGAEGVMRGSSIVGFGSYHYRYASGREGDFFEAGFSPRKRALTIYVMAGFAEYEDLLARLGKYSTGKSCLYVKRLADIDFDLLREMLIRSVAYIRAKYPPVA